VTLPFQHVAALVVAIAGSMTDLWVRRIPNVLTFGAAAGATGFYLVGSGWTGLGFAVSGWLVGGLMFLPLFALRGLGGGDVKLMAALGAWVGPGMAVWVALYTALAGGVFALLVALARGYTKQAFRNIWSMLSYWRIAGLRTHPVLTVDSAGAVRLPYAVPIAVGLAVTLWLQ
jgi:prepilin peptidase CpaA